MDRGGLRYIDERFEEVTNDAALHGHDCSDLLHAHDVAVDELQYY